MLVKGRILALLVASSNEFMTLVLDPFSQAELVLCGAEHLGLLLRMFTALYTVLGSDFGRAV